MNPKDYQNVPAAQKLLKMIKEEVDERLKDISDTNPEKDHLNVNNKIKHAFLKKLRLTFKFIIIRKYHCLLIFAT